MDIRKERMTGRIPPPPPGNVSTNGIEYDKIDAALAVFTFGGIAFVLGLLAFGTGFTNRFTYPAIFGGVIAGLSFGLMMFFYVWKFGRPSE